MQLKNKVSHQKDLFDGTFELDHTNLMFSNWALFILFLRHTSVRWKYEQCDDEDQLFYEDFLLKNLG